MKYAKYKPTGIAWLPEVPEEWEMRPFKSLYGFGKGLPITKENLVAEGVPVVSYGQIHSKDNDGTTLSDSLLRFVDESYVETNPQCLLQAGDMAIADTSEDLEGCGNAVVMDRSERVFAGYHTIIGRIKESNNAPFLAYEFRCDAWRSQIRFAVHGVKLYSITKQILSGTRFVLPPLPTQRTIVAFLDEKCGKVDRLVAAKEKEVALLKELKQSMIAEAVTGKVKRKSEKGKSVERRLVPSGIPWLPEVPEGWATGKVRQYFKLRATKVSEKDYPPLSVAKIGVVPQLSDVALSMAEGDTRKLVKEGDYVVNSRSDRKGSCGIAPRDGSVTTISIVLEPHDIERKYVHYLFRSTPWVEEFYRNGRGIVADLWTTNYNQMRNMMFPVPPLAEQREIVAHIEAKAAKIDAAVAGLEREIAALKEYKQRLIADVVTGQRRVA